MPRASTVERILLDNKGSVTPRTIADALGSIRYYDEGKWSEENWDFGGFYQFHSPEGDDLEFKTIFRTIFDATDLEMFVLRGQMRNSAPMSRSVRPTTTSSLLERACRPPIRARKPMPVLQ